MRLVRGSGKWRTDPTEKWPAPNAALRLTSDRPELGAPLAKAFRNDGRQLDLEDRHKYAAAADELLIQAESTFRKGPHGLYLPEYSSTEYTYLTAEVGIAHCLNGNMQRGRELLELIKRNVPRDDNGQFTLSPDDRQRSTVSSVWVGVLAWIVGDHETIREQRFRSDADQRFTKSVSSPDGLFASDSGESIPTYKNALIGLVSAQQGDTHLARQLLDNIDREVPLLDSGIHAPFVSKGFMATTPEVGVAVGMLKIQLDGPIKSERYCVKAAELCKSPQTVVLASIMYSMLSGCDL